MSHRSLFWPITLIAIVAATLLLILTSAPAGPRATVVSAAIECPDPSDSAYPTCVAAQTAEAKTTIAQTGVPTTNPNRIIAGCPTNGPAAAPPYPPYADCMQTRTAILLQTERAGYTATPTSPPASGNQAPADTPTPTFTMTPTFTQAATADSLPTDPPTATRQSASPTPTATPTAALEGQDLDSSAISCVPGEMIIIEGSADASAALIVSFGGRPVGGGFSRGDGSYRIWLRIGDERPGSYPVAVEDRDTSALVQGFSCIVPAFTPTPTPPLVP
ncbi:hypothetical protein K2Z83_17320 [Oscillochloris sp. ZM17-4]|uniref:hypothetical protein n=1 Tax=Oscillochloris sp. ZM17-4 TaxID=2866714 RepID=UPI001C73896F|nr:hypothetical protein [Oscillochloris sp. ZM17-4]MBX0329434.1 hypothetical protein [Oscillochloris sp. ZM17-4]